MVTRATRAHDDRVVPNDCVAFIDMPRMLREIVDEALSHADVRMVDERSDGGLVEAVDRSGARLVIISSERLAPADVCRLLEDRPHVKVFAIADDGRDGCLYELRPNLVLVGELSPETLAQTVLGDRHGPSSTPSSIGR
jgi:hypothetical protein